MFILFQRKKVFTLKFLFIESIHSIYLILVQYVLALLLMYELKERKDCERKQCGIKEWEY